MSRKATSGLNSAAAASAAGPLRAASRALARHADRAAVQLDQAARERQAHAQAHGRALQRAVGLGEHLEDLLAQLGRDAHAAVAHPGEQLAAGDADLEVDPAAGIGELDGVVEQVEEHLREPGRVGIDAHAHRLRAASVVFAAAAPDSHKASTAVPVGLFQYRICPSPLYFDATSASRWFSVPGSTGLVRWWSNPASEERRRSASWPQPVTATSVTRAPCWRRSARATS